MRIGQFRTKLERTTGVASLNVVRRGCTYGVCIDGISVITLSGGFADSPPDSHDHQAID